MRLTKVNIRFYLDFIVQHENCEMIELDGKLHEIGYTEDDIDDMVHVICNDKKYKKEIKTRILNKIDEIMEYISNRNDVALNAIFNI